MFIWICLFRLIKVLRLLTSYFSEIHVYHTLMCRIIVFNIYLTDVLYFFVVKQNKMLLKKKKESHLILAISQIHQNVF